MESERPLVSVTLPSVREALVTQRIADFAATNPDIDYELVIASPFKVEGPRVVHVPETEMRGAVRAQAACYEAATGRYIVWTSDDAFPTQDCLRAIVDFVKSQPDPFIATFRIREPGGSEEPQGAAYGRLTTYYGAASRETIETIGGYMDTAYRTLFGDADMGLRCWKAGGRVEVCHEAWLEKKDARDLKGAYRLKWMVIDGEIFYARWNPIHGTKKWHPTWAGGPRAPLTFREKPLVWLGWQARLVPWYRDFYSRMTKETLYPLVSKMPGYSLYRRAKERSAGAGEKPAVFVDDISSARQSENG